ncbi:MAG: hypothetical protein LBQ31_01505, partial [Bacteroidales bacterium]|nr:hypothetical protein [Bacteroidales bacterium]
YELKRTLHRMGINNDKINYELRITNYENQQRSQARTIGTIINYELRITNYENQRQLYAQTTSASA